MVLSLFLTETLGVTAGGIIVPGYIAMNLEDPYRLITTFGISIITYLIIKLISQFILVYGKRRLVLALLIGFLLGYFTRTENNLLSDLTQMDFVVIGNIIPGLIASWMDRQGVLRTVCTVLITAGITKLFIMVLSLYQLSGVN
jgi:poly-gamma-glutamate biosynthesis protein PgsC/CapC